ncbi:MAG: hypothetical protein WA102_10240 [Candidatus Methanoperedens sp.]
MTEFLGINGEIWLIILTIMLVILTIILVILTPRGEETLRNAIYKWRIFTVEIVCITRKHAWIMVLLLLGVLLVYLTLAPGGDNAPEKTKSISIPTSTPSLTPTLTQMPMPLTMSETNTSQSIMQPSIVIDGNPSDWVGIEPIMTDPKGDSSANVQGSDMKSLYAFNDDDYLYLMLELYSNPNGSREIVHYAFEIANDLDSPFLKWDYEVGGDAQGNAWLWNLTEYDTRINHKNKNPYGLTSPMPGVEAIGKVVFEIKIPLYAIGNPKSMIIRARTQPYQGEEWFDQMPVVKLATKSML